MLKSIKIPHGVKIIGDSTFESCYNLESINIPDSVTTIGHAVFKVDFTGIKYALFNKYALLIKNNKNLKIIVKKDSYAERYMKNNYPNVQLLLHNPKEMQIAKTHIAERKIRFGIMTAIGVFGLTGIAATVE